MFSSNQIHTFRHILKVRVMAHQHSTPGSFTCDRGPLGVKPAKEQIPRWIFTSINSRYRRCFYLESLHSWLFKNVVTAIMYLRLLTDKRPRRVMEHSVRCDITLWLVDLVSRLERCSLKGPQSQVPLLCLVPASAPSESLFPPTSWCFLNGLLDSHFAPGLA